MPSVARCPDNLKWKLDIDLINSFKVFYCKKNIWIRLSNIPWILKELLLYTAWVYFFTSLTFRHETAGLFDYNGFGGRFKYLTFIIKVSENEIIYNHN